MRSRDDGGATGGRGDSAGGAGRPHRNETAAERMDRNWNELLQELRVTQTGVQILSGFLLTLPFQQRFATLDDLQRTIFLVAVSLSTVATALLVSPVSSHRLLFRRGAKDTLVTTGDRLAKAGLVALGLTVTTVVLLIFNVVLGEYRRLGRGRLPPACSRSSRSTGWSCRCWSGAPASAPHRAGTRARERRACTACSHEQRLPCAAVRPVDRTHARRTVREQLCWRAGPDRPCRAPLRRAWTPSPRSRRRSGHSEDEEATMRRTITETARCRDRPRARRLVPEPGAARPGPSPGPPPHRWRSGATSLQYDEGEGPCLDAAMHERWLYTPDVATDQRWPRPAGGCTASSAWAACSPAG